MNMTMNNNLMNKFNINNKNNFNKNNFNNNNNLNNNNNINNINNNKVNVDIKFDPSNIIEFGKKDLLINFLDESTNKNYKIYTSPNLKIKNILYDLLNQFPEINYTNNQLMLNGQIINIEYNANNYNLNENSIIIIKT